MGYQLIGYGFVIETCNENILAGSYPALFHSFIACYRHLVVRKNECFDVRIIIKQLAHFVYNVL